MKNQIFFITLFVLFSTVLLLAKNAEVANAQNLKEKSAKEERAPKKTEKKTTKIVQKGRATSETGSLETSKTYSTDPKIPKINDKAYSILNNTLVGSVDIPKKNIELNRKWDFKMSAKEVQDITVDMNFADMNGVSEASLRSFQFNFITPFEKCDVDADNILTLKEFTDCLKTDPDLRRIAIPDAKFPLQGSVLKYKNSDEYAKILFRIFDDSRMERMNFYNYMSIRLLAFSWMKCSSGSPFIEEANFECAIEIAAGWKTLNKNQARSLFEKTMSFSGSENKEMDFVVFSDIALSVRIYGKINGKEDNLATKNEMNMALDTKILPQRFNQKIIESLFQLATDSSNGNSLGIDLISFCFYDFWLKIFDENAKKVRFNLNVDEFIQLNNHPLFPGNMQGTLKLIPQNDLSVASYSMFEDTNSKAEADHFVKSFLQSNEKKITKESSNKKWNLESARGGNKKLAYKQKETLTNIFNILDSAFIGKIGFYDFATFIQVLHMFTRLDPNNAKGRLVAGNLEKEIFKYSGYPIISKNFLIRSKRIKTLNADLYMDFASVLLMMRVENFAAAHTRRTDKSTMTEIELKNILSHINRKFIPDAHLKICLRSGDKIIPVYDWECAFTTTESSTLKFYENSFDYLTTQTQKIKLGPTEFNNKDFGL